MTVKLLTEHHLEIPSFKGGCTGSSESTLVKMPHCSKSHVAAYINFFFFLECPGGTFGSNCSQACGQCIDTCNFVNGSCSGNCLAGYKGELCNEGQYIETLI